ncbi:MAG TPA: TetR/AcrR family transcriptional regulator [Allosphingosinicella sp.]|jgi:AcrR family transcriptional regulator
MSRPRGRPPAADELGLRQRIVDAAAAEFAAFGYEGARVERVARAAGCNRALVYFYFKDKGGLFQAALDEGASRRVGQMAAQPGSLAEALVYWLDRNLADPVRIRLVMQEALAPPSVGAAAAGRREYLQQQLGAVRQFQQAGLLRSDVAPHHLLGAILALTSFPAAFPAVAASALDTDQVGLAGDWRALLESLAHVLSPPLTDGR